jgi:hypothetical protein
VRDSRLLEIITRPFRWAGVQFAVHVAAKRQLRGVELRDWSMEEDVPQLSLALERSLNLIETVDPRRFAELRRHVERIVIARGDVAYYSPDVRGCVIGSDYIRSISPAQLALVLVHEAAHARLRKRGLLPRPEQRQAIELLCFQAETEFAEHLPDRTTLIEWVQQKSTLGDWTGTTQLDRIGQASRRYGVPKWLIRLVRWRR